MSFYIYYIDYLLSHKEIYINGDAYPEGFSIPLAFSNIGQSDLQRRMNTNRGQGGKGGDTYG